MVIKFVALLVILPAIVICRQNPNSELDRYIQDLRKDRMTEEAKITMSTISSIRTDHTTLTFIKDSTSGTYGTSYGSTFCPIPGTDSSEIRKISNQIEADINGDIEKIRPLADSDSSGFITTSEAEHFRRLIEFGWLADYVSKKGEPESIVARSKGISGDRLARLIKEYKNIADRARKMGIAHIPPWPYNN